MKERTFKTNSGMKTNRIGKMAAVMAVVLIALCTSCKKDDPIVQTVEIHLSQITIQASPSPREGGYIAGNKVNYQVDEICNLTAVPNSGYKFVNWSTADGTEVFSEASFSFTVKESVHYFANFVLESSEAR